MAGRAFFIFAMFDEIEQEEFLQCPLMSSIFGNRPANRGFLLRQREGAFTNLITRHLMDDDTLFKEYFRVTPAEFQFIHSAVEQKLEVQAYNRHVTPISSKERLCITLR